MPATSWKGRDVGRGSCCNTNPSDRVAGRAGLRARPDDGLDPCAGQRHLSRGVRFGAVAGHLHRGRRGRHRVQRIAQRGVATANPVCGGSASVGGTGVLAGDSLGAAVEVRGRMGLVRVARSGADHRAHRLCVRRRAGRHAAGRPRSEGHLCASHRWVRPGLRRWWPGRVAAAEGARWHRASAGRRGAGRGNVPAAGGGDAPHVLGGALGGRCRSRGCRATDAASAAASSVHHADRRLSDAVGRGEPMAGLLGVRSRLPALRRQRGARAVHRSVHSDRLRSRHSVLAAGRRLAAAPVRSSVRPDCELGGRDDADRRHDPGRIAAGFGRNDRVRVDRRRAGDRSGVQRWDIAHVAQRRVSGGAQCTTSRHPGQGRGPCGSCGHRRQRCDPGGAAMGGRNRRHPAAGADQRGGGRVDRRCSVGLSGIPGEPAGQPATPDAGSGSAEPRWSRRPGGHRAARGQ